MINLKLMFKIKFIKKTFAKVKLSLFLFRLIFTNKNKIRYLLFDSMNLRQFLISDNWDKTLKS